MSDRILVVEDHPGTLELLTTFLQKEGFEVIGAANGDEAFALLKTEFPDLVLLDIMLSGIDGFDVCRAIRNDPLHKGVPVVMCTACDTAAERAKGMEFGADDYITKPFNNRDLVERLRLRIRFKRMEEQLLNTGRELQKSRKLLHEQTQMTQQARLDTINALLAAVAAKDPYTSQHAQKVAELAEAVALKLGFDKMSIINLHYASLLHDIGKIGVPIYVLGKEDRLEKEELEIIKRHPEISAEIIRPVSFLHRVVDIIRHASREC